MIQRASAGVRLTHIQERTGDAFVQKQPYQSVIISHLYEERMRHEGRVAEKTSRAKAVMMSL